MAKSFHQYSPRAQAIVCVALSFGVLSAALKVLIEPERAQVQVRRTRLAAVNADVAKATLVAQRLPAVQKEIASLEAALLQTTAVLSDEKDAKVVLAGLYGLASDSNLAMSSFTPKPIAEREQHTEWPIEVGLEGGYHDLARFFDRVASDPRLISVSNLQFRINSLPTRRGLVLATCMATTFVFTPTAAQAPPPAPPPTAPPPLKIGTRVGLPEKSGYDDGGRRDPFVTLIVEKPPAVATAAGSMEARAKGLAGVAVVDAFVKGIITSGDKWLAIIAGPNGVMYLAHTNDRLHDGSVRRIDRDAVVFLARVPDGTGKIVSREVRKGLRAGTGDGR